MQSQEEGQSEKENSEAWRVYGAKEHEESRRGH
jgi:hypothetical protein